MLGFSCFLMAPAEAATPAISGAAAEKMAAASPQRERHRAWAMCVDHVANLVIAQGGNMEKVRSMIPLGCEEEESRLTGSLIAKYGYEQGNAAMRALRQTEERRFTANIEARDHPPASPNFVERTIEGWDVRRSKDGGCHALLIRPGAMMVGKVGTMLERTANTDKIVFILAGSAAQAVDKNTGNFTVSASRYAQGTFTRLSSDLQITSGSFDDGQIYSAQATGELLAELADSESVQFLISDGWTGYPGTFPVRGLATAWRAVQRCAPR